MCCFYWTHFAKKKLNIENSNKKWFESFKHQKWEKKEEEPPYSFIWFPLCSQKKCDKDFFSLFLGDTKIWLNLPKNDCQFSLNKNSWGKQ
jgi:hypothetical protein